MDGPSHEPLFREMKCLNAESNLVEIVKYLRFTKDEGPNYQKFLAHYLPMLVGKPEFDEFIGDLEDKALAKTLKTANKAPTAEELAAEQADAEAKAAKKVEKEVAKGEEVKKKEEEKPTKHAKK